MYCGSALDAVYPRWRGEHVAVEQLQAVANGLSPLARGTLIPDLDIPGIDRFIPAGAGNTVASVRTGLQISVYPRWRGEHFRRILVPGRHFGLSPLARGTLGRRRGLGRSFRFIPAGAGNTYLVTGAPPLSSVYPRWRGEHKSFMSRRIRATGLSPLARGTPHALLGFNTERRFIPAGAGNTVTTRGQVQQVPVYPRWRGEHISSSRFDLPTPGLSPLARGTRAIERKEGGHIRFIPAGAGNTLKK